MTAEQVLQWMNGAVSLHRHIRIIYVVDGVEVEIVDDDDTPIISARAPNVHRAVELLMEIGI